MCNQQVTPNMPSALRKAIYTLYIGVRNKYVKLEYDPFYCLLAFIGDILLFGGVLLLLVDFILFEPKIFCLPCSLMGGTGFYGSLNVFMANYQCSHMNQIWFTCFYLGIGFNALSLSMRKL